MPTEDPDRLDRLAIHTITNKPWSLRQCIDGYTRAGIPAISVWRNVIEPLGAAEAARMLTDAGLAVPALVRGGFFPGWEAEYRQWAIDENRRIVEEAATLGAEMVVLVVGAVPGMPLNQARQQVQDGIAAVLPDAAAAGVKLAIEPLHPMYADNRSCVVTMNQARRICQQLNDPHVGIACDVYHVWWDETLPEEIARAADDDRLFGFHICDWRVAPRHILTDRGLMGDGCIDVPGIRGLVERAGFTGYHELEIFSEDYWAMDQADYLEKIKSAYRDHS